MKAKITRPDGSIVEVEGTAEEISDFMDEMKDLFKETAPISTPEAPRITWDPPYGPCQHPDTPSWPKVDRWGVPGGTFIGDPPGWFGGSSGGTFVTRTSNNSGV